MKIGEFAIYKGKEYMVIEDNGMEVILCTDDKDSLKEGFILEEGFSEIYFKIVPKTELEKVYLISNYAVYKGTKFSVFNVDNGEVTLCSYDREIAKKYKMEDTCVGMYYLTLTKSNVEKFIEEKQEVTL